MPQLSQRLLQLRDENKVYMRESSFVRAQPIEDLARQAMSRLNNQGSQYVREVTDLKKQALNGARGR